MGFHTDTGREPMNPRAMLTTVERMHARRDMPLSDALRARLIELMRTA
jgi:hypothetical protein